MIDLHCHILPQIDDGSELLETSMEMAKTLILAGVTDVVCTPHMPGVGILPLTRQRIHERFVQLTSYLKQQQIPLTLHMSGEHSLTPLLFDDETQYILPFGRGDTKALLVELPWHECPKEILDRLIFELQCRDLALILAHPERSPGYDPDWLEQKVNAGNFFLQIEAGSLFGHYGRLAQQKAQELLDRHLVHLAASDSHNVDHCRLYKVFSENMETEYSADMCNLLLEENPRAILNGDFEQIICW